MAARKFKLTCGSHCVLSDVSVSTSSGDSGGVAFLVLRAGASRECCRQTEVCRDLNLGSMCLRAFV